MGPVIPRAPNGLRLSEFTHIFEFFLVYITDLCKTNWFILENGLNSSNLRLSSKKVQREPLGPFYTKPYTNSNYLGTLRAPLGQFSISPKLCFMRQLALDKVILSFVFSIQTEMSWAKPFLYSKPTGIPARTPCAFIMCDFDLFPWGEVKSFIWMEGHFLEGASLSK